MMQSLDADSEAASALQNQLQEIKNRWNHVNEQLIELRSVLLTRVNCAFLLVCKNKGVKGKKIKVLILNFLTSFLHNPRPEALHNLGNGNVRLFAY